MHDSFKRRFVKNYKYKEASCGDYHQTPYVKVESGNSGTDLLQRELWSTGEVKECEWVTT